MLPQDDYVRTMLFIIIGFFVFLTAIAVIAPDSVGTSQCVEQKK